MKVILADDENWVRSGLKSMLSELDIPLEVIGEAKTGEELMELVENLSPDLVFADIRMPRLTGLEALRKVKDKAPNTNWVMLTGFADFEYAREALRLGALNYLLKPATLSDLSNCVNEAFEKHLHAVNALHLTFESEIVSMIHDTRTIDDFDSKSLPEPFQFRGTVFHFDSFLKEEEKALLRKRFIVNLQSMAVELMNSRSVRFGLATLPDGNLSFFTAWDSRPASDGRDMNERFERSMERMVSLFKNDHSAITALQTESCANFRTALQQLSKLGKLSAMRNVLSIGTVLAFPELNAAGKHSVLAQLSHHLENVCRLFCEKDFVNYTKELAVLEKVFAERHFQEPKTFQAVCDFLQYTMDCKLHEAQERTEWFAALHRHGENMYAERANENRLQGDLVQKVINHVNQHYMKDIGIGQIAADINVTPNYLSTLFHKRCGFTFMKFLTETRMLRAKELLLSRTSMKIQQVAEEVGYYSTRHFTKLFKEYFGFYPSEIREKQVNG